MENQFNKNGFIPKHGGYENLMTFQKADIIFLGTKYFCEKYISKFDRTYDQMVQAARSGKMNILEGSMASGASWDKNHPYYHALTKKHLILNPTYELYQKGIESISPEVSANVLLSLTNITIYMLAQQLKRLEQDFLKEGGLRERMTKARLNMRNNNQNNSGLLL